MTLCDWSPNYNNMASFFFFFKLRIEDGLRRAQDSCLTYEATHYLSATGNKGIARQSQQAHTNYSAPPYSNQQHSGMLNQ